MDIKEDKTPYPKGKAGRPPGSKNLRSRESSKVLAQLGFDPIAMLVRSHDDAERAIAREERKERPSGMAIAQLMTIKQNASKELLRYGYARTTETVEVATRELPPLQVTLTPAGWKPGDPVPGQSSNEDGGAWGDSNIDDEVYPEYDERDPDPAKDIREAPRDKIEDTFEPL